MLLLLTATAMATPLEMPSCPLGGGPPDLYTASLSFCSGLDAGCCTPERDTNMMERHTKAVVEAFGDCKGCVDNFKQLACAINCMPSRTNYISAQNKTVRLCAQTCKMLFTSCSSERFTRTYSDADLFCSTLLERPSGFTVDITHESCLAVDTLSSACASASNTGIDSSTKRDFISILDWSSLDLVVVQDDPWSWYVFAYGCI